MVNHYNKNSLGTEKKEETIMKHARTALKMLVLCCLMLCGAGVVMYIGAGTVVTEAVEPLRAVIAAGIALAAGVVVFLKRHTGN